MMDVSAKTLGWQFTKENYANGVPAWIRNSNTPVEFWSQFGGTVIGGVIKTLGGDLKVAEDDWIIQDITTGRIWVA